MFVYDMRLHVWVKVDGVAAIFGIEFVSSAGSLKNKLP